MTTVVRPWPSACKHTHIHTQQSLLTGNRQPLLQSHNLWKVTNIFTPKSVWLGNLIKPGSGIHARRPQRRNPNTSRQQPRSSPQHLYFVRFNHQGLRLDQPSIGKYMLKRGPASS